MASSVRSILGVMKSLKAHKPIGLFRASEHLVLRSYLLALQCTVRCQGLEQTPAGVCRDTCVEGQRVTVVLSSVFCSCTVSSHLCTCSLRVKVMNHPIASVGKVSVIRLVSAYLGPLDKTLPWSRYFGRHLISISLQHFDHSCENQTHRLSGCCVLWNRAAEQAANKLLK